MGRKDLRKAELDMGRIIVTQAQPQHPCEDVSRSPPASYKHSHRQLSVGPGDLKWRVERSIGPSYLKWHLENLESA